MNLYEVLAWLVLGGIGSVHVLHKGIQNGQDVTVGDAVMSVLLVAAGPITVVFTLCMYIQANGIFSSVLLKAPKKKRGKK